MPAKKAKKKANLKKKAKKVAKKTTTKKKVVKKAAVVKPLKPTGSQYSCVLCGVEVAMTRSGLGISRLMCCGQPMTRT